MNDIPAFPVPTVVPSNAWMTLRDYFAGQALMGTLAYPGTDFDKRPEEFRTHLVKVCYKYADAMLNERGEK